MNEVLKNPLHFNRNMSGFFVQKRVSALMGKGMLMIVQLNTLYKK